MVSPRGRLNAASFLACFAAAILLQLYSGAYGAERGMYSDEAAHFMNGLLIRDYVYDGLGENPVTFAESYYQRFPKIAVGMWPPLFHVTLGLVLLPGWRPDIAAVVLVALTAAWTT